MRWPIWRRITLFTEISLREMFLSARRPTRSRWMIWKTLFFLEFACVSKAMLKFRFEGVLSHPSFIFVFQLADFGLARCLDEAVYYKAMQSIFPYKWTAPEAFVIEGQVWCLKKGRPQFPRNTVHFKLHYRLEDARRLRMSGATESCCGSCSAREP